MHRFIEFRSIGSSPECDLVFNSPGVQARHLRLALRADGGLWLLGNTLRHSFELNRGQGWLTAMRTRLCTGDRIRLGDSEIPLATLCAPFGIEESDRAPPLEMAVPGHAAPVPLVAPSDALDRPRRNASTGQIEHPGKEIK